MKKSYQFLLLFFIAALGIFLWSSFPKNDSALNVASSFRGPNEPEKGDVVDAEVSAAESASGSTLEDGRASPKNSSLSPEERADLFKRGFVSKFGDGWDFHVNSVGDTFRAFNGKIVVWKENEKEKRFGNKKEEVREETSERIATVAKKIGGILGVNDEIEFVPPGTEEVVNSKNSSAFLVKQSYRGLEVYQGWVKLTTGANANSVFLLNLSVVDIDKGTSADIPFGIKDAKSKVKEEYDGKSLEFKSNDEQPVFYSDAKFQEPAWVFYVHVEGLVHPDREVLVGIHSEEIIRNISKTIY